MKPEETPRAPGPGSWEIDLTHFPRPASPIAERIYSTSFPEGFREGSARYGILLDHLAYVSVDGWMYNQPVVVGAPRGARTPPKLLFQLAARLHPQLRARARTAAKVFETMPWRQDVARWQSKIKPARIRAHLALLATPVRDLDDAALVGHARACIALFAESARIHGAYTVPAMFPAGDLIAHAVEWTGLSPQKILGTLASSSPISAGNEPTREWLLARLRSDAGARRTVEGDAEPGAIVEELARRTDETGAAARGYFDAVGHRALTGYDVSEPVGMEVPFVMVEGLRKILGGRGATGDARGSIAEVRDQVPDRHRVTFDSLLDEARAASAIRDERALFNDYWSAGVARRALLEVGRRLAERGDLPSAEHAVACLGEDLEPLLCRRDRALATVVVGRFDARRRAQLRTMPMHLGRSPEAPPPAEWMPGALRRVHQATLAVLSAIFGDGTAPSDKAVVRGIGVSAGTYAGPARVVHGPADFHRLRPGDVLVARTTSPTYNIVLPLLGAIVTDRGGALSHAAIVAREFGIPGVVGCRDATTLIADGARVRVDGGAGECALLS